MPHVKMSQKNAKPGYTLIELLVALSIGVVISLAIIGTTIQGFRNIRAMQRSARLYSNAVFVQDLVNYWVKQGRSVTVNGSDTLEITLPNGIVKTIKKSGDEIITFTTPPGITSSAPLTSDADVRVTKLQFTTPAAKHSNPLPPLFHSARTEIDLETGTGDGLTKFSAISTTATRNQ